MAWLYQEVWTGVECSTTSPPHSGLDCLEKQRGLEVSEGAVDNPRMPMVLAAGGRAATTLGSPGKGVTRWSLHFITILLLGDIYL